MVTCAECGKKINENEAVCDNVIIRVYQRGVFYTVSYGAKMFCSVECRDKWNNRMNALVKRLRKRFLIFLAFVISMPIIFLVIFQWVIPQILKRYATLLFRNFRLVLIELFKVM
ncbi:hypothetical protein J7K06_05525 [Candidatus Bathyarchaeota archaeon]|nr:hypothetical protein [Candidatus Bathyarchaeota archaeon]